MRIVRVLLNDSVHHPKESFVGISHLTADFASFLCQHRNDKRESYGETDFIYIVVPDDYQLKRK